MMEKESTIKKPDIAENAAQPRLKFIGTSHISEESVSQIKKAVETFCPTIICVELDHARLSGLLSKKKPSYNPRMIMQIGVVGYVFAVIGGIVQRKLGKMVGLAPGSDMLAAVTVAREKSLSIALIDQPIHITLRRLSAAFTLKEFFRFFWDVLVGIFAPAKMQKRFGLDKIDLRKVPSSTFISAAIGYIEERYPSIYRTLIAERNTYMVAKVQHLLKLNPGHRLLIVVGAGHLSGMKAHLQSLLISSS